MYSENVEDTLHRQPAHEPQPVRDRIRRDSHLALGCGFGFALLVVAGLIIFELA